MFFLWYCRDPRCHKGSFPRFSCWLSPGHKVNHTHWTYWLLLTHALLITLLSSCPLASCYPLPMPWEKTPVSCHVSLSCVCNWSTQVIGASLSTAHKKRTKTDETVSQINVAMVGIDSLLAFGENAHAQPHPTVCWRRLCPWGQRWGFLCSLTATLLGGRQHQQRVKITVAEQFIAVISR